MSGHTPGPWEIPGRTRAGPFVAEARKNGRCIADVTSGNDADARLIAAAPELLAFAEAVAEYDEYRTDDEDPREILTRLERRAQAAIAKARGAS